MVKQIQTEVRVMYNLDHPNIIKLYNHFEEDNYIYLMIEYAGADVIHLPTAYRQIDAILTRSSRKVVDVLSEVLHPRLVPQQHLFRR